MVCGSRYVSGPRAYTGVQIAIQDTIRDHNLSVQEVVVGDARGVDRIAAHLAAGSKIPVKVFAADWDFYGPSAGPRRNGEMLLYGIDVAGPRLVVLAIFVEGIESKGTENMVRQAEAVGVTVVKYTLARSVAGC